MASLWNRVIALGTDGGDACANGDTLGQGVHLLWTMSPELGFPVDGYHVLRRRHRRPEWTCTVFDADNVPPAGSASWTWQDWRFEADPGPVRFLDEACGTQPGLFLPGPQTLTVVPGPTSVAIRASGSGVAPVVETLAPDLVTVAGREQAQAGQGGTWSVESWAAEVGAVRFAGEELRVCSLCFGLADETSGWMPLTKTPLLLPVVRGGTANTPLHLQDRPTTVATARARLSPTLPGDVADRLARAFGERPRQAVEQLLRDGRGAQLPSGAGDQGSGRAAPSLRLDTASVVAVSALDPDVSRMLGLTWHDPVTEGRWDYQMIAHHGAAPYPSHRVGFDDLELASLAPGVLDRDGLTFASSSGLEVVDVRAGRHGLRVAAPLPGTLAGVRLPSPVQAVTLRLTGDDADAEFTAWRGSVRVATETTADGVAHLEHLPGINAVTWGDGPVDLLEAELFPRAGPVGDVSAFAWNVAPVRPRPVGRLRVSALAAVPEIPAVRPDGTAGDETAVAGLDWADDGVADAARPVRVHVARAFAGDGTMPEDEAGDEDAFTVRNAHRPAVAFARSRRPGQAWPGPDVPHRWTERLAAPGRYRWRVRGIDVFGRLGPWSAASEVEVTGPPAPLPPDGVTARYLDPEDPYLSDEERSLAASGSGLLVQWTWPAGRRLQAPQIGSSGVGSSGEFRVYLRRGDPNLVLGTVTAVARDGDRSRLSTDLTWPGAADALAGCLLRVGAASFEIAGHDSGEAAWFDVLNLTGPLQLPGPGPFSVRLSPAHGPFTDLTRPRAFDRRVHVEPAGELPVLTSTVVRVTARGETATVTLADPLPGAFSGTAPGLLVSRGVGYRVTGPRAGQADVDVVAAPEPGTGVVLPGAGDPCTVWASARYHAWVPGVDLTPAQDQATSLGLVAVSASDGDPAVPDDVVWSRPGRGSLGGRPGREGRTALAAALRVPHRTSPPTPLVDRPPDGDIPAVQAEPADWYGRAHYTLAFPAAPGATGYRVMRAAVAAVCALDQALRQRRAEPYADGPFGGPLDDAGPSLAWLAEHYPALSPADLTADPAGLPDPSLVRAAWRDWATWYYPALSNRELMKLADLDTHRDAFLPAHPGTVSGPPFRDTFDGRGLGRFLYRLVPVDASGNAGPWSLTFPVVQVRDVTPPATPVLLSAAGAPGTIVLTWRAGTEPDLGGYRIWRAERPGDLADVRRTPVYAEVAPAPDGLSQSWSDPGTAALTDVYYRVAAFDLGGNVSAPTAVTRARALDLDPPDPPAWDRAERVLRRVSDGALLPADTAQDPAQAYQPAVALAWTASEDDVTCRVERRLDGERPYSARSDWLSPADGARGFSFADDASPSRPATYRIRARDGAGNEQRYRWNAVTVDPVGGTS